ncbi:MAG TPA: hypothetical protein IAC41_01675, partial [Candidatus Merdenecus merdavium]|nr:hypothetical protein [Candidatus Merdenecus merdavium]
MKNHKIILIFILIISAISIIGLSVTRYTKDKPTMSYNDFLASVENGTVKEVAYNYEDDYLSVKLKTDQNTFQVPNPKSETFQEFLLKHDVDIISKNSTSNRNTAITFM